MRLGQGKNLPVIMKCWAGAVKAPVKGKQQKQIPKPWQIKPGFSEGSCRSSSRRVSGALVLPGAAACSEPCPAAAAQLCSHAAPLPGCSCSGPQQNIFERSEGHEQRLKEKCKRNRHKLLVFVVELLWGFF